MRRFPTDSARQAGTLFALCGLLAVVSLPVPGSPVGALLAVAAADFAVAAAGWLLPWRRWPARASLVLAVPGCLIVAACNAVGITPSAAPAIMFVLLFVWIGMHHGRWASLLIAPLAAASYAGGVLAADTRLPLDARAVIIVSFVCVLVAETIAAGQQRLRRSEAELRFLAEHTTDLVTRTGLDGIVRYASPSAAHVVGHEARELVGTDSSALCHPDFEGAIDAATMVPGEPITYVRQMMRGDGTLGWFESVAQLVKGTDGEFEVLTATRDVTDRRLLEVEREHQATHDHLTGLANRGLLVDRLTAALAAGGTPTVAFIDLDGFKQVNDKHGHDAGDQLLSQVARRLVAITRASDTVARLGGDEFVLLLTEPLPLHRAASAGETLTGLALAARIETELSRPYDLGGRTVQIGASVGVAEAKPGESTGQLINRADRAMYQAKDAHRAASARRIVL